MEKNKLMMIIIIALLSLTLLLVAGLCVYMALGVGSREAAVTPPPSAGVTLTPEQIETIDIADTFKTNLLKGVNGKEHVISADVSFAINKTDKDSKKLKDVLDANGAMIKSNILSVIRNRTFDELSGSDATDVLAAKILSKLQEVFDTNLIVEVYINSLYIAQS